MASRQVGKSAIWQYGKSAIWQFGNSAIWQFGNSAIWQFGNLAMRQFGNLAMRQFDNSTIRQFDNSTIWQFGNSAIRQFGNLAIRQFGNSAIWQFGNSAAGNKFRGGFDRLPFQTKRIHRERAKMQIIHFTYSSTSPDSIPTLAPNKNPSCWEFPKGGSSGNPPGSGLQNEHPHQYEFYNRSNSPVVVNGTMYPNIF